MMLSKIRPSPKDRPCVILLTGGIRRSPTHRKRGRRRGRQARGVGRGSGRLFGGAELSCRTGWPRRSVTQQCACGWQYRTAHLKTAGVSFVLCGVVRFFVFANNKRIKDLGLAGFRNNTVSYFLTLRVKNDVKIRKWLSGRGWIKTTVKKTCSGDEARSVTVKLFVKISERFKGCITDPFKKMSLFENRKSMRRGPAVAKNLNVGLPQQP